MPSFVNATLFVKGLRGHQRFTATADQNQKEARSMTAGEKAKAKTEQAGGKAEAALGNAVGNDRMAAEGQARKSTGDAREAKEKTKDAFRH